jgi:DNA-binding NarL/FixJ family response regulator
MDVRMPGMSGIEATRRIKVQQPEIAILALSAYDDAQYLAAAREAGAAGYLLKNARGSELVAAIRAVHARGSPPAR